MRVYLSGPITGCNDDDCKGWREDCEAVLHGYDIKTLNPMRRDYRDNPCSALPQLVENDKIDIEMCDIVLVNYFRPSVGTSMEILLGWQTHKRVIVVSEEYTEDAWLVYHSHHIYRTFEEAYDKILRLQREYEEIEY